MLTRRITEGEKRHFKTNLKRTPITIMVTSVYGFFFFGCCKFYSF